MKLKRYYIGRPLAVNSAVILEGEEFHHMANVMRTRVGESVELFCGDNYDYIGVVEEIGKKSAQILVKEKRANICNPKIGIDVFQALAKGDKLSLIMQKITELGAHKLVLFESKFCDVKANSKKPERLESISISACKQCGRSTPVKLEPEILKIGKIKNIIKEYDTFLIFYEAEDNRTLSQEILKLKDKNFGKIAIMIGPEGGFEKAEVDELKNAGAIVVSLGYRILRTETAAMVGVGTIIQMLEK